MKKVFNAAIVALAISVIGIATSCQSYKPPVKRNFPNSATINKPYDEVWNKVIRWFGMQNIPVKSMEKVSGFISAEDQGYRPDKNFCDCGTMAKGIVNTSLDGVILNFNVIVEKESDTKTSVTVNVKFDGKGTTSVGSTTTSQQYTCYSTGKYESAIFEYLNQ